MRRSPHDREIVRIAVPALGALAAEPLYLLVDTAIVGHLGTPQLAAFALAATVLGTLVAVCLFLTYGTTAQVARLHGAGEHARAGELWAQALWLAGAIGVALTLGCLVLAGPLIALLGGEGHVAALAERYLRLSAAGLTPALIALAAQGFLRGISDLRTPLYIVVAAQAANVVLELLLVYGLHWGLDGSAAGTVAAQLGMGAAFVIVLRHLPAAGLMPRPALLLPLVRVSGDLFLRSVSLVLAFATSVAVLARVGATSLGAGQVVLQMFDFLALVIDAIAIAGQVLVGNALGAGDAAGARAAGDRVLVAGTAIGCAFAVVLLALAGPIASVFSDDPAVIERVGAVWVMFALMQPAAGAVFALDGILIGAGDTRYLGRSMLLAGVTYGAIAIAALHFGWGIQGVWAGLLALIGVRLATLGRRYAGPRWAITGASVNRRSAAG